MRHQDLPGELRLQQIVPGPGRFDARILRQPVLVRAKAQGPHIDTGPVVVGILELLLVAKVLEIRRIIGLQKPLALGSDKAVDGSTPPDIELWVVLLRPDAGQGLTAGHPDIVDRDAKLLLELLLHALTPLLLWGAEHVDLSALLASASNKAHEHTHQDQQRHDR